MCNGRYEIKKLKNVKKDGITFENVAFDYWSLINEITGTPKFASI